MVAPEIDATASLGCRTRAHCKLVCCQYNVQTPRRWFSAQAEERVADSADELDEKTPVPAPTSEDDVARDSDMEEELASEKKQAGWASARTKQLQVVFFLKWGP
jgi:hypothetical protein